MVAATSKKVADNYCRQFKKIQHSIKKETNAIIIGEPPGEKPNSYSENDEMKLPNSGLIISYSTKYYKFLDKDVPAFEPDIRADPNWKDFSAGVDPVLEKIKAIIQQ